MFISTRKPIILSRKAYETADGVAKQVLYNITRVVLFANFDFERQRLEDYINLVHQLNKQSEFKLELSTQESFFLFFVIFCLYTIYAKSLLSKTNPSIKSGHVIKVWFSTTMEIFSFGMMAPNISIIKEACLASNDYFILFDKEA